jgi:transcriptional regulator with XRE-family HTH domain
MSIILDEADDTCAHIAARIGTERESRNWSLADLSARSGVSKAMLSKIERKEVSPTAVILARVATAFGQTLAQLLEQKKAETSRLQRAGEQPRWRDPATGYIRRQVFQSASNPLELVEVSLPAGAAVGFPASAYANTRHVVWLLSGQLDIREGNTIHSLKAGDRLEFGPAADSEFRNRSDKACRYLVALVRR